jgi:hypothetical protein
MGYACPVCEVPQRDGEHLAHHLAFTAMLHGGDHEEWLAEHAPGWTDREPAELAADVTEHAEAAEYHEVFEDTVHGHDRGRPDVGGADASSRGRNLEHASGAPNAADAADGVDAATTSAPDAETEAIIEEARELTRRMYSDDDTGSDGDTDPDSGGDADTDD